MVVKEGGVVAMVSVGALEGGAWDIVGGELRTLLLARMSLTVFILEVGAVGGEGWGLSG